MLVETYFNHVWISGFVPLLSAAKERYWDACRAWALEKKQCHGKSVEKKRIDLLAVRWFFDPPFAEFLNTKRSKASRPLSQNAIIVESCSFEGYPYAVWIVRFLMFLMHLMALKGVRHSLDWFVWKPSYQSQHPKWISPYQRFSISILVEGFQYKSKMTHGNHNIIITNSQSKQHQNMLCCIRIIYIYIYKSTTVTSWLKKRHGWNTKKTPSSSFSGFFSQQRVTVPTGCRPRQVERGSQLFRRPWPPSNGWGHLATSEQKRVPNGLDVYKNV